MTWPVSLAGSFIITIQLLQNSCSAPLRDSGDAAEEFVSRIRVKRDSIEEPGWLWPGATVYYTLKYLERWDKLRDSILDPQKRTLDRVRGLVAKVMTDDRNAKPTDDTQAEMDKITAAYAIASKKPQEEYNAATKKAQADADAEFDRLNALIKTAPDDKTEKELSAQFDQVGPEADKKFKQAEEKMHRDLAAINKQLSEDKAKIQAKVDAYNFVNKVLNGVTRNPSFLLDVGLTRNARLAMAEISAKTCIRFVEINDKDLNRPRDYLDFRIHNSKCFTSLGRTGFRQVVWLARECAPGPMDVAHEILHALGFEHEFKRHDRFEKAGITVHTDLLEDQSDTSKQQYNQEELKGGGIIIKRKRGYNDPYCYKSIMNYPIHAGQVKDPQTKKYDHTKSVIKVDTVKRPLPADFYPHLIDAKKSQAENDHARMEMFGDTSFDPLPECDYRRINELYKCAINKDHTAKNPGAGNPDLVADLPCFLDPEDKKTVIHHEEEYLLYSGAGADRNPVAWGFCKVDAPLPGSNMMFASTTVQGGCIEPPTKAEPKKYVKMEIGSTVVRGTELYRCIEEDGNAVLHWSSIDKDWNGCGWPLGKQKNIGKDKDGKDVFRQVTIAAGDLAKSPTENKVCTKRKDGTYFLKHVSCMKDGQPFTDKQEELSDYAAASGDGSVYEGVQVVLKCAIHPDGTSSAIKRRHCAYKDPYGPKEAKPDVFGPGCYKIFDLSEKDPLRKDEKKGKTGYGQKVITCERKESDQESVGLVWVNYDPKTDPQNSKLLKVHNLNTINLPACPGSAAPARTTVKKDAVRAALPAVLTKCETTKTWIQISNSWAKEHCDRDDRYLFSEALKASICRVATPPIDMMNEFTQLKLKLKSKYTKSQLHRQTNAAAARCFLECLYDNMREQLNSDVDDDMLDNTGMMMLYVLQKFQCIDVLKRINGEAALRIKQESEMAAKAKEKQSQTPASVPKNELAKQPSPEEDKKDAILLQENRKTAAVKIDNTPIAELPAALENAVKSGKTKAARMSSIREHYHWFLKLLQLKKEK